MKLFELGPANQEEMSFKIFHFLAQTAILLSRAESLEQF